jgi:hypothetical protein
MSQFDEELHAFYDARILTLAKIKTRTLGADALVLAALNVLVYAQMEGGVKELSSRTIKDVNRRKLPLGVLSPSLLRWRNSEDISRFKATVTFDTITDTAPFLTPLAHVVPVKGINRLAEFNQMNWISVSKIYKGLKLDLSQVELLKDGIDELVSTRNETAHRGKLPGVALHFLEKQTRGNVALVENVLTDLTLQLLSFFGKKLHLR